VASGTEKESGRGLARELELLGLELELELELELGLGEEERELALELELRSSSIEGRTLPITRTRCAIINIYVGKNNAGIRG